MATPHNRAEKGQIAETVLMPGDPLRARWIAETYLEDAHLVTDVRNVYCYTGQYKGKQISVMASGMGMPSIGIYSYELYKFYDVENIIRVGSAGAYSDTLNVMDIVLASSAWSESSYAKAMSLEDTRWQYPSEELNEKLLRASGITGRKLHQGPVHSSDIFYHEPEADQVLGEQVEQLGLLCVDMESYALFHNAKVLGKKAACLLTISDSFVTKESLSSDKRENAFSEMIELALEAAVL